MRRTAQPPADRGAVRATGIARTWQTLAPDRRLAAIASVGLFLTLFLPWYQETVIATGRAATLEAKGVALTGWGAFSFVEAAVLLVAAGVVTLLYKRAQGRAFHLPGGDGGVITAAGAWTSLLIVWRIFDKQGTRVSGPGVATSGVEWGIFVALGVAALLVYSGSRIRAANQPEPPLPGEDTPATAREDWSPRSRRARPPRPVPAGGPAPERIARDPKTAVRDPKTAVRDPTTRVTRDPRFGPSVVPEDPPTLRIERPDRRSRGPTASSPAQPTPSPPAHPTSPRQASSDEQLTIPLDDEGFEEL